MERYKQAHLGLPQHDLSGQKFGRLTVIKWISRPHQTIQGLRRSGWECLCDCGTITEALSSHLIRGIRSSCGCQRRGQARILNPESGVTSTICQYRNTAKRRGKIWALSFEDVKRLLAGNCYYCGEPPMNKRKLLRASGEVFEYNGIDRLDNSLGYIEENVVSCCRVCNIRKRTASAADFIAWAKRIAMRHT